MKDKKKIIIVSLSVLAAALAIGMTIVWISLKKSEQQKVEIQELIALEQEEMLNDLQNAQIEYEELKTKILSNDSLLIKLEQEQLRTQQLYEELQSVKATNAAEIKRLKKELKTLRGVLESYVVQIDSLFRENAELKVENTKLIAGKKKAEQERNDLAKEKQALTEKVDIAAQLDATNIGIKMLRSNGKETKNVKKAKQISVSCTISRNVTAKTGDKVAYVRIMQPDGEPLTKSYSNTFKYENRDMSYSMYREFEFDGEEVPLTFYWDIEETLQQGSYRAYIFVDGNMIGEGVADFE
ncbi:MAG: hypothetical protein IKV19_03120 [Bacteroidaceae bacterium]|nr:hypothetical protein [Bacteroidaceae bacterium]